MSEDWEELEVLGDRASAASIFGLLQTEGLPARIDESSPIPGLDELFRVMVPVRFVDQARQILSAVDISESELDVLANDTSKSKR